MYINIDSRMTLNHFLILAITWMAVLIRDLSCVTNYLYCLYERIKQTFYW